MDLVKAEELIYFAVVLSDPLTKDTDGISNADAVRQ
jgi:hypothetical protein